MRPDQLVKSKETGLYYVVVSVQWYLIGGWQVRVRSLSLSVRPFLMRPECLRVVGNNYRARKL